MEELGQETSMHAAVAHVPTPSAGPSRRPPPAWDRRAWVVVIPLALIVIYAFIPSLANEFVLWDDDQNFLDQSLFSRSGRGPGEVGLDYVSGRRLPTLGLVAVRGAICLLRT